MPCKHLRLGEFVTDGERLAAEAVHEFLSAQAGDWFLLTNGVLSMARQQREIDQLLVGPSGVFVVDVKSFGGAVRAEGDRWILADGSSRRDPLGEVGHLAGQLKGRLAQFSASLSRVWVEGRVLFTADDVDLSGVPGAAGKCFWLTELARLIAGPQHVDSRLPASLAEQVVRALDSAAYVRARQSWKTLGEYALVEPLAGPETPNRRSYRARDRHGEPALVRLYDLSAVPASQRKRALAQARSEYEALDALGKARVPGTVRVRTPFAEVPDMGGELFYFALEQPTGATLADRLANPDWPAEARLETMVGLCRLLARIHETTTPERAHGTLVHRRLHSDAIFLGATPEGFVLTGFDVARATAETAYPGALPFPLTAYDAPELGEGLSRASTRSDVYSVGILVYQVFTGELPFGGQPRSRADDGEPLPLPPLRPEHVPFGDAEELAALLDMMTAVDPSDRPENLSEVLVLLDAMQPPPTDDSAEKAAPDAVRHPLPAGALLAPSLRVERLVGRGSTAWTYLVVEESSGREWVAKVLREPTPDRLASIGREFGILRLLHHPAIVGVVEVSCRENAPYHLLLEHCRGRAFAEVFDEFPALVEQQSTTPVELVHAWADVILEALGEMHRSGVLHRDLSPGNLVLTESGPKIVDFGLAWAPIVGDEPAAALGTFPYRPPECGGGRGWTAAGDLYGLAVILCQLLLGRLPFEDDNGIQPDRVREELFPADDPFLQALRTAIAPDPGCRFATAAEFRQALSAARAQPQQQAASEAEAEQPAAAALEPTGGNEVPYLDDVLKVYPACTLGAAETRGLDTRFARDTYVPTRLDREVKADIPDGKLHLVLLSGNPGDGKTAFLQRLAEELGVDPVETRGKREWTATLESGLVVRANLDGSAADGERGSDQVLDEFLDPFFDGPPQGTGLR